MNIQKKLLGYFLFFNKCNYELKFKRKHVEMAKVRFPQKKKNA